MVIRIVLLTIAAIVFAITAFVAFTSTTIVISHLVGLVAIGLFFLAVSAYPWTK